MRLIEIKRRLVHIYTDYTILHFQFLIFTFYLPFRPENKLREKTIIKLAKIMVISVYSSKTN